MSRTVEIASNAAASAWTDLSGVIPWPEMKVGGSAHQLEVGTGSGFNLDDDAGTRTLPTKRVVRVIETATTPDCTLFKGRVSDKTLNRGRMPAGDAKAFDVTLDDNNSQVYGIPVDGWVRPAETGRARAIAAIAAFANGSPRASTVIATTYAPNTNTVAMPVKTYDLTDLGGVLRDCAETEGKQVFITVDDQLFLDLDSSTAYAAGLSITDVTPNHTTSFPPGDPSGEQQGNEFFTGATMKYGTAGSVSDVRAAAETAHDYWRTVVSDGDATATTAAQRLATMLDNQSIEELTYRCQLQLTAAQVDLIKYGNTVSFRSAAAGVLSPVTLRVASLYWEPIAVDLYIAHLELGTPEKLGRRVRSDGTLPAGPWACIPTDYTVFSTIATPNIACVIPTPSGGALSCTTLDPTPDQVITLYNGASYRAQWVVNHSTNSNRLVVALVGQGSAVVAGSANMGGLNNGPPADNIPLATVDFACAYTDDYYARVDDVFYVGRDSSGVSVSVTITWLSGPDPRFDTLPACSNGAPASGQTVHDTSFLGDASTTSFTTDFPYASGSLRVEVNGLDWTNNVTETDPSTGDYDLAYPPPLNATVKVYYVRA